MAALPMAVSESVCRVPECHFQLQQLQISHFAGAKHGGKLLTKIVAVLDSRGDRLENASC
jgi:hypothetical protein